jgi:hypothetical protein
MGSTPSRSGAARRAQAGVTVRSSRQRMYERGTSGQVCSGVASVTSSPGLSRRGRGRVKASWATSGVQSCNKKRVTNASSDHDSGELAIISALKMSGSAVTWSARLNPGFGSTAWRKTSRLTGRREATIGMIDPDMECPTRTRSSNRSKASSAISAKRLAPEDWSFKGRSTLVTARHKLRDKLLPAPSSQASTMYQAESAHAWTPFPRLVAFTC